jgi:hypothetical protein
MMQEGEWVMKGKLGAFGVGVLAAMMLLSGCGGAGGSANAHKTAAAADKPEISGTYVRKAKLEDKLVFDNGVMTYQDYGEDQKVAYSLSDKPVQGGLFAITFDDTDATCRISDKPKGPCVDGATENIELNELLVKVKDGGSQIELLPYLPNFAIGQLRNSEHQTYLPWAYPYAKTAKDWKSFQEPDRMTLIRQ